MKFMWLDRISGPDLRVAINVCAGHFAQWTINDDKRMTKLAGYVAATLDHCHIMQVHGSPSDSRPSLYDDVDIGSAPDMKSTSGCLLTLEGPGSCALRAASNKELFPDQLRKLNMYSFQLLFSMRLFQCMRFARSSSSIKWCWTAMRTTLLLSQSLPVVFHRSCGIWASFAGSTLPPLVWRSMSQTLNAEYVDLLTKALSVSAWDSAPSFFR